MIVFSFHRFKLRNSQGEDGSINKSVEDDWLLTACSSVKPLRPRGSRTSNNSRKIQLPCATSYLSAVVNGDLSKILHRHQWNDGILRGLLFIWQISLYSNALSQSFTTLRNRDFVSMFPERIVGFYVTSLNFKLQNYRSYEAGGGVSQ